MEVMPDIIEFDITHILDPNACLPKLQAAGWTITNAQDEKVEASRNGHTFAIRPHCIELSGFTPPELFGGDDEREESALLVTGLIKQLAAA
jgi:hypothetical protein